MEIEQKFDKMNNEQQKQFIESINKALIKCKYGIPSRINEQHKDFKNFLKHFVRNDEEVIDHNIEYFEISCPMEYLDTDSLIANDNDYMDLIDGWHLNVYWIFECGEYDDLINSGILIEL